MKTIKNVLIFLAGMHVTCRIISDGCRKDAMYPREGHVEYEDENIRVVRLGTKINKVNQAVILHKNHE